METELDDELEGDDERHIVENDVPFSLESLVAWATSIKKGDRVFLRRWVADMWRFAPAEVVRFTPTRFTVLAQSMGAVKAGEYTFYRSHGYEYIFGSNGGALQRYGGVHLTTDCDPVPCTPETEAAYNATMKYYAAREKANAQAQVMGAMFTDIMRPVLRGALAGVDLAKLPYPDLDNFYQICQRGGYVVPDVAEKVEQARRDAYRQVYEEGNENGN